MEISLQEIFAILWNKAWIIALCLIVGACVGFGVSRYLIEPTYSSKMSMYVNNNSERGDSALNINDINASQKLVATYIEILKSDVVLNKVMDQLEVEYTNEELRKMISASAVNNTEILEVKVTSKDPEEAAAIANTLSEVAPPEIIRVVQAGDVQLIDKAVVNDQPVAPSVAKNTVIGGLLGVILAIGAVLLLAMLDISIKSSEDLSKRYGLPVLGAIPDIVDAMASDK